MNNLEKFNAKELTYKHARLMDEPEISPEKKKRIKELEDELRQRLQRNLIGDVLPVRPTIKDLVSKSKPVEKKAMAPLIPFNFEVLSGLNTRIDRFRIDATSKDEAWEKARKKAEKYPGDVHLKIS